MIVLHIPEASPSLNQIIGKHWTHYRKFRYHWSVLVLVAKNQSSIGPWKPLQRASVRITRESYRLLDPDNFVGGLKVLIDGLRDQGLIVDDSPDHISLIGEQVKITRTQYPCTKIEIKAA